MGPPVERDEVLDAFREGGAVAGLSFLPQELEHYQTLFNLADTQGQGFIDGPTAGAFLYTSDLPQDTLWTIWEIADSAQHGCLTQERFFVALRLVAHAQAGQLPRPELEHAPPPQLPELQATQRQRSPSEDSVRRPRAYSDNQRSPSIGSQAPPKSDVSDMQPVISSSGAAVVSSGARWVPTQKETRKYASLFKKLDRNNDGYIDGAEAKDFLQRSKLQGSLLGTAWEHADADGDGKVDFREFVVLVHIVTCVVKGRGMPDLRAGLPSELVEALQNLESVETLLAMPKSPLPSPLPSFLNTPAIGPCTPALSSARPPGPLDRLPFGPFSSPSQEHALAWGNVNLSPGGFGDVGDAGGVGWGALDPGTNRGNGDTVGFAPLALEDDGNSNAIAVGFADGNEDDQRGKKKKKKKGKEKDVDGAEGFGLGASAWDAEGVATSFAPFADTADFPGQAINDLAGISRSRSADKQAGGHDSRELRELFRELDTNGDGKLSKAEVIKTCRSHPEIARLLGLPSTIRQEDGRDQLEAFFQALDVNCDRTLTFQEFQKHFSGHFGCEVGGSPPGIKAGALRRGSKDTPQLPAPAAPVVDARSLAKAVSQFKSMLEADQAALKDVRQEFAELITAYEDSQDIRAQLSRQVADERAALQERERHSQRLERDTHGAKQRLTELREQRRTINFESISIQRDRLHFADELDFLRRTTKNEENTLDAMQQSNSFVDKSCRDLEIELEHLERQRRHLSLQVRHEKELFRQEERRNAELMDFLDRQRREQFAYEKQRREAADREQSKREMQSGRPAHPFRSALDSSDSSRVAPPAFSFGRPCSVAF